MSVVVLIFGGKSRTLAGPLASTTQFWSSLSSEIREGVG